MNEPDTKMCQSLGDFVRVYDNAMPEDYCRLLIETFESRKDLQIVNGAGKRPGLERSRWTEMDIGKISSPHAKHQFDQWIKQYKARYESDCRMTPLPEPGAYAQLILKRYIPGNTERFQTHFDSLLAVSDRYLVILWYLNEVATGGETEFVDLSIKVKPNTGRLLIFPPYWLYRHVAHSPLSGPKYILSTYLLW